MFNLINTLLTDRVFMSALFNLGLAHQCIQTKPDKATSYAVVSLLLYSAMEIATRRLIPTLVSLIKPRFIQLW